ncbi:HpcH/HpaI aldolase family protein [Niabella aquatica]
MNNLKSRLRNGEMLTGTFLSLGNAVVAEIVASAGFDWVMIDLEHGMGSETDVLHQLQGIDPEKVSCFVRVEGNQRQRINKVLDFGVQGVMCPRIETADEVRAAVSAMYYPPKGTRGVAKLIRASEYGARFDEYQRYASEELLCVIQIETINAIKNLEAIAAVKEVDVLFIGPSDLSMALGVFGQLDHSSFTAAVDAIVKAAQRFNKQVGILLSDPYQLKKYYDMGVRFFAYGTDAFFISNGAGKAVSAMKSQLSNGV